MESQKIKCPHCGHFTFYSPENPHRPFCSARCKLIDLGQWANESYRVPVETQLTDTDLEGLLNDSDVSTNPNSDDSEPSS